MQAAEQTSTDVLISGAGPVGLTLANELTRYGIACRIVDKQPHTKEISKALILHVRTQEVLETVGITNQARAEARPLRRIELHAYGKHIGHWQMDKIDSPLQMPVIIGQNRTEHLLQEHLGEQGRQVEFNTEVMSFEQDEAGVTAVLHHKDDSARGFREEIVRAKYLVGCEGSDSMVRKSLGLAFDGGRYEGEQFIQADTKIRWPMPKGVSYLFLTTHGYMMVIEMPNDVVRVFISLPDPDPANKADPTLAEVQENLIQLSGIPAELYDPVWLARYRTSHRRAPEFRKGRAFIAGDAAHVHVPIGGQGMNTGIQDAFNLSWKLAYVLKGWAKPDLLDSFSAERQPVAAALLDGTDKAYTSILSPSEILQRGARFFGPFLLNSEMVQTTFRNTLEEIKIAYDHSPLNGDYNGSSGPKAGQRTLDAEVVRLSDYQTVRLYDLMRGPAWTLLLFGGPAGKSTTYAQLKTLADRLLSRFPQQLRAYLVAAETTLSPDAGWPADAVLIDAQHYVHHTYGVKAPCLYLMRPDGFVGFRAPANQTDALEAYVANWFVPQPQAV